MESRGFTDFYRPAVKANSPEDYIFSVGGEAGEVFSYRTGMTVYEEEMAGGVFAPCGWNAAGYPLNVLSNCPSRFDPGSFSERGAFSFELDGVSGIYDMKPEGVEQERREDCTEIRIRLSCGFRPFGVTVVTRLDGTDAFERYIILENRDSVPVNVSHIDVLGGGVEVMDGKQGNVLYGRPKVDELYELGYMDNDGPLREGDFSWHKLAPDTTTFGGWFDRRRWRYPMAALRNKLLGTTWLLELAYSGGYRFAFDLNTAEDSDRSALSWKVSLAGPEPALRLAPGEKFVCPSVHVCCVHGGLDDAVHEMHKHLRRSVLKTDNRTLLVGGGMGAEHDMSVETSKRFADQLKAMGAEVFIVDAGWNCPPGKEMTGWYQRNGDWYTDGERYPNGIAEVRDYCHSIGLKFGLWLESERFGDLSKAFAEHQDFLSTHTDGKKSGGFVDMSNPEAAAWIRKEVERVITDYKPDLFRVDYNIADCELSTLRYGNGRESSAARHVQAVYEMYRSLKEKFPDVVFENCASGGGRCDLGQIHAFNHSWVSDNQLAPRSIAITNGMTMVIPSERVDRLVSGMGCHLYGEIALQMRAAMFGHISLNVLGPRDAVYNPEQMGVIRHSVQLYKDFIRPFLPDARFYHHTPNTPDFAAGNPMVWQLVSEDRTRSVLGVFTAANTVTTETVAYPKGLNAGAVYRVTLDNSGDSYTETGAHLMRCGLRVTLDGALSSELLTLCAEQESTRAF